MMLTPAECWEVAVSTYHVLMFLIATAVLLWVAFGLASLIRRVKALEQRVNEIIGIANEIRRDMFWSD